ncbi:GNAT family N-acetyltransferase [Pararoseomonas indoligenes]|uniref:GNAT family N-acetyltransferase n=1 Tax=Roseomonas indoligenes TaxID=2820811 RepID=A0A940MPL5_9PROT|nr:GNAT family N-acetyltransferase [Pararoseomonas indoligenes]MBP0491643.1 GNAT family N-acetyltransferase [Pararoseomonas indoligenes]
MSDGTHITVEDAADPAARAAVLDGLMAYNAARTPPGTFTGQPLLVVLRDAEGAPVGGVVGRHRAGWLYLELFHIPESYRGQGLGQKILERAEAEARARGLAGVWLETYAFQAPGFYARMGYTTVGVLPGCPPGQACHFLAKRLDGAPLETP